MEYKSYESKIVNFFFDIFCMYSINIFNVRKKKLITFKNFSEFEIKLIYCLREFDNTIIIINDLKIFIKSNYDLTWVIYSLDTSIEVLRDIAKKNDVYLLK